MSLADLQFFYIKPNSAKMLYSIAIDMPGAFTHILLALLIIFYSMETYVSSR